MNVKSVVVAMVLTYSLLMLMASSAHAIIGVHRKHTNYLTLKQRLVTYHYNDDLPIGQGEYGLFHGLDHPAVEMIRHARLLFDTEVSQVISEYYYFKLDRDRANDPLKKLLNERLSRYGLALNMTDSQIRRFKEDNDDCTVAFFAPERIEPLFAGFLSLGLDPKLRVWLANKYEIFTVVDFINRFTLFNRKGEPRNLVRIRNFLKPLLMAQIQNEPGEEDIKVDIDILPLSSNAEFHIEEARRKGDDSIHSYPGIRLSDLRRILDDETFLEVSTKWSQLTRPPKKRTCDELLDEKDRRVSNE